jgi:hypothetical protein
MTIALACCSLLVPGSNLPPEPRAAQAAVIGAAMKDTITPSKRLARSLVPPGAVSRQAAVPSGDNNAVT